MPARSLWERPCVAKGLRSSPGKLAGWLKARGRYAPHRDARPLLQWPANKPESGSGQHHLQHPDRLRLRVMPAHLHIPEPHPVHPFRCRYLVGRAWVLGQALFDQRHQRLTQPQCMLAGLRQCAIGPMHGNGCRRGAGRPRPAPCVSFGVRSEAVRRSNIEFCVL